MKFGIKKISLSHKLGFNKVFLLHGFSLISAIMWRVKKIQKIWGYESTTHWWQSSCAWTHFWSGAWTCSASTKKNISSLWPLHPPLCFLLPFNYNSSAPLQCALFLPFSHSQNLYLSPKMKVIVIPGTNSYPITRTYSSFSPHHRVDPLSGAMLLTKRTLEHKVKALMSIKDKSSL